MTLGSMVNYSGEYVQLPWGVCSTALGLCLTTLESIFNYLREYFQLPWGVCSTTLGPGPKPNAKAQGPGPGLALVPGHLTFQHQKH